MQAGQSVPTFTRQIPARCRANWFRVVWDVRWSGGLRGRPLTDTYERQRDRLRQELTLTQIDRHSVDLEKFDVEGILAFAERVLPRASDLWVQASLNQKQRLQQLFFGDGVAFDGKQFVRTGVTANAFNYLTAAPSPQNEVASPTRHCGDVLRSRCRWRDPCLGALLPSCAWNPSKRQIMRLRKPYPGVEGVCRSHFAYPLRRAPTPPDYVGISGGSTSSAGECALPTSPIIPGKEEKTHDEERDRSHESPITYRDSTIRGRGRQLCT